MGYYPKPLKLRLRKRLQIRGISGVIPPQENWIRALGPRVICRLMRLRCCLGCTDKRHRMLSERSHAPCAGRIHLPIVSICRRTPPMQS